MLVFLKFRLQRTIQRQNGGKELINIITKDRVIDSSLRKQIASNDLYICKRHFTEDHIWVYGSRKTMKDDDIPSLNLPVKSIASPSVPQHLPTVIKKREGSKIICQTLEQHEPPAIHIIFHFQNLKVELVNLS